MFGHRRRLVEKPKAFVLNQTIIKEVSYEADEAYMRTNATEAEIAADFEGWFETASAWEPTVPEKKPETQNERIAALEGEVDSLKAKNALLEEELQATKIILGVE